MTNKTALITGANKGIGFETARQLGRLGYRIWLGSRDDGRGRSAAERLSEEGHSVRCLSIDVTSDESVRSAVNLVEQEDGNSTSSSTTPEYRAALGSRQAGRPSTTSAASTRPTCSVRSG